MKARHSISLIAVFLSWGLIASSQDNAVLAEKVTASRQENAQKTRDYSWTKRTEVKVKGDTKSLVTEIVRYTVDGEMQATPISADNAKTPRGVRGKVAKKKGGEMKDWMAELGQVLHAYSLPTAGNLLDFLNKAKASPDGAGQRLDATGVVQAGDTMSLWLDEDSSMTRTEVKTEYDGSAVTLKTEHDTTPDGLDFVARTTIVVPDKGVEMTVENFSYKKER